MSLRPLALNAKQVKSFLVKVKHLSVKGVPSFKDLFSILLVGLVVLDGYLTRIALLHGQYEGNPNPFVIWSIDNLWSRAVLMTIIVLVLRKSDKTWAAEALCYAFLCLCLWNTLIIKVFVVG